MRIDGWQVVIEFWEQSVEFDLVKNHCKQIEITLITSNVFYALFRIVDVGVLVKIMAFELIPRD